jgi:hypothetical protein
MVLRLWIAGICAVGLLVPATTAAAQPAAPPLTSNRPGIGDSEALVPAGAIQVEAGVQGQGEPPGDGRRWAQTWGQLAFRFGVTPRIEIFSGWDGLSLERRRGAGTTRTVSGVGDLRLGAKIAVLNEDRHGMTLTISPMLSFPIGSSSFSSGSYDGSFRLLLARSLPRDWSVSGNVLFLRTSDEAGRYWNNAATIGVSRAITASVSAFVEMAGVLLAEQPDAWTIDGGVAWVARPNLQWDVSVGHTFHDRGDDWFVSAGITIRRR